MGRNIRSEGQRGGGRRDNPKSVCQPLLSSWIKDFIFSGAVEVHRGEWVFWISIEVEPTHEG